MGRQTKERSGEGNGGEGRKKGMRGKEEERGEEGMA